MPTKGRAMAVCVKNAPSEVQFALGLSRHLTLGATSSDRLGAGEVTGQQSQVVR